MNIVKIDRGNSIQHKMRVNQKIPFSNVCVSNVYTRINNIFSFLRLRKLLLLISLSFLSFVYNF